MSYSRFCHFCNEPINLKESDIAFYVYTCGSGLYLSRDIPLQSRKCFRAVNGITTPPMKFKLQREFSKDEFFTELDAPKWLTAERTVPGSTGDGRWFWNEHVLTLEVGNSIDTDFSRITRIE